MNPNPKHKPIRLNGEVYKKLQQEVLERDQYRCIISLVRTEAPPHHIVFRSQGGDDKLENLATLSHTIHDAVTNLTEKSGEYLIREIIKNYGYNGLIKYFLLGVVVERR